MAKDTKKETKKVLNRFKRNILSLFTIPTHGHNNFNMFHFILVSGLFFFLCYIFWFNFIKQRII